MRRCILRWFGVAAVAASLGLSGPRARADFLSNLIGPPQQTLSGSSASPQQAYTIIASNWAYTPTGNMPTSSAVTVTANPDGLGNAGLEFQGGFHDNPGNSNSDALIQYTVSLSAADIAKGLFFTDAHLNTDAFVVNGSTTNTGSISITETIRDPTTNAVIGTLTNFDIWSANGESTKQSDVISLDPTKHFTSLIISKDILASSDSGNSLPQTSHVDQSYSVGGLPPPVPEPSSLALVVLGTAGFLGGAMRRRIRRAFPPGPRAL